jgi:hypothetical protein
MLRAARSYSAGFDRHVGAENICENIEAALKRAEECMKKMHVETS